MKQIIIIIMCIINTNILHAQTDEDFLVEAFFPDMTPKSKKVYIHENCMVTAIYAFEVEILYKIFSEKLNISDTTIVDELHAYFENTNNQTQTWNTDATVFQSAKYKKLKFTTNDNEKARYIDKPIFTKNREYALISVTHYTYHKLSRKYRLNTEWKRKYEINASGYTILFKKENGKWIEVGRYLRVIS